MPAHTGFETARAFHTILDQGLTPVVPLLNERIAYTEAMALDGRASIGAHAHLRESRDLLRHFFRLRAGSVLRGNVLAEANAQAFLREHLAPRENDLQCAALADNAGQTHGSPIDERNAPAATI